MQWHHQAARLSLAGAAAGGASGHQSGLPGCVSGRPEQICWSIHGKPHSSGLIFNFSYFLGEEGGFWGAVWEGWLGKLCSQRWKETRRTSASPCICCGLELQAKKEDSESFCSQQS